MCACVRMCESVGSNKEDEMINEESDSIQVYDDSNNACVCVCVCVCVCMCVCVRLYVHVCVTTSCSQLSSHSMGPD